MRYRESGPSPALAEHIKLFWAVESPAGVNGAVEMVLPDGCPELVFNFSDRFLRILGSSEHIQPSSLFAGQMTKSIAIRPSGRVHLFGVRFQPCGAYALSGYAMRDLNDAIVGIQELLGSYGSELEERLNLSCSFDERTRIFEDFYFRRLASLGAEQVSRHAVRLIEQSNGMLLVKGMAKRLGTSERTIERAFQREVGLSPKMLSRIIRFQRLIGLIQNAKTPGSLDALLELGYYDQPHAIRDFREFSGTTPLNYFKTTHELSDLFVGGGEEFARH